MRSEAKRNEASKQYSGKRVKVAVCEFSGKVSVYVSRGADNATLRLEAGVMRIMVIRQGGRIKRYVPKGIVGLTKVTLCKNGLDRFCRTCLETCRVSKQDRQPYYT